MSDFTTSELLRLLERATKGLWKWGWRDDKDAPGSIYADKCDGHAYAVAMCPRYGREDFQGNAELVVYLVNNAAHIARLLRAYEAVEVGARMGLQIRGPNHFMRNALAALSALRGGVERVEGFEQ
jgi:hypothetical protein